MKQAKNQTKVDVMMPNAKPLRAANPKIRSIRPVKLMKTGKAFVAFDAAIGETYRPVKKKESAEVDGMPTRNPPSFPPHFSVASAMAVTQTPIAKKVTTSRNTRSSVSINAFSLSVQWTTHPEREGA
jgi:hypothetical protein